MPAQPPIASLDFLQQIIAVNFGNGDWFGALASFGGGLDGVASVNCQLSFPGEAGGTPGLPVLSPGQVPPPNARVLPYTLKKADLTTKLRTAAGKAIIGFPVSTNLAAAMYYISINEFFPQGTPFNVAFNVGGGDASTNLRLDVWTVKAKDFMVGAVLGDRLPNPAGQATFSKSGGVAGAFSFSINPTTFAVKSLQ